MVLHLLIPLNKFMGQHFFFFLIIGFLDEPTELKIN